MTTGLQLALAGGALVSLGMALLLWRLAPAHPDLAAEPPDYSPDDLATWRGERRFSHPHYWAAFTFTGA